MLATKCSVPITTLKASTYNLPWGSSVYAKLLAYNLYGNSAMSSVGNGAVILTVPDAPLSVAELYSSRTATSLGVSWTAGVANGGAPVIDYTVTYTTGTTSVVVPNILTTQFTATGLATGSNYIFSVQSRNKFGLSQNS